MPDPCTIAELLDQSARDFGDRPALVEGDQRVSYADLPVLARQVARAFLASGVRPGDRVAIWAPNRVEFPLALLGAQVMGAVVVPLNTRYRGHEARAILERSRASALVVWNGFLDIDYLGLLASADSVNGADLAHLHTVVDLGDGGGNAIGWIDFLKRGEGVDPTDLAEIEAGVEPDSLCDILFTSGTTGVAKGAMSSHGQTIAVGRTWAKGAELSPMDRYAVVNPFFHSFGYKAGLIAALTAGSSVHPVLTFEPEAMFEQVQEEAITVLPGAPTIFLTLIDHPSRDKYDLSSLRFAIAGAASVPETLFAEMVETLGFDRVAQAYGMTECVMITQTRVGEEPAHIAETVGLPVPGLELRIVDAAGNALAPGTDGEILVRSANVMRGYFEDEAATAEAIDSDGWLHTGDVGHLDQHGCLKITGRIKDLFIVGGFNVYPAEIESVLCAHPDVTEAAVIGVPDDRMGAVGRAYLTLRPGAEFDESSIAEHCRERLANFKVPRQWVPIGQFPRNASGKILKRELSVSH